MRTPIGTRLTPIREAVLKGCSDAQLEVLLKQKRVTSWPYYSKIKFLATRAVSGGGFAYTLTRGTTVRAFSYGVNEQMTSAGFLATDGNATTADTNLTTRSQTTGGQNVLIHGMALQIMPAALHLISGQPTVRMADARFLAALHEAVSVEVSLNGDENRYRLGTMGMLPGAGGLSGGSEDASGDNSVAGKAKSLLFPTNGWGVKSNFFRIPEGLVWRNQSNSDSNLNLIFTVQRTIELFSGGSPENIIGDIAVDNAPANVATAEGYDYPTELVIEIMCFMIGEVVGPRTHSA